MDKVYIFGHRNPDTDSVTSSISLEYLKKELGINAEARTLGEVNEETKFVLKYFNFDIPKYLNDVHLKIKDIGYRKNLFISEYASVEETYSVMNDNNVTGLPVVNSLNKFIGIITAKTILKGVIDFTNSLSTSYENILKSLKAKEVLRFDEDILGNIIAVSYRSTTFLETMNFSNDDILIVGDRHSIIEEAINSKIKLIILTDNSSIKEEYMLTAKENKINIIRTGYSTFMAIKKISLSNYIKNLLEHSRNYTVLEGKYYNEFLEDAKVLGYNNYPVVDNDNVCKGLIRLTDTNKKNRKKVILVDHNEFEQSVVGLDEASIEEVIDHHKIGDISTSNPINFRNMAVGSTNTIIYYLYLENRVEIPKNIASIMLSGIISDTINLTSPTTTETDKFVVSKLEEITELSHDKLANKIYKESLNIKNKTIKELINSDIKAFQNNHFSFKISQILTMNPIELLNKKEEILTEIEKLKENSHVDFIILSITSISENGSYIFYTKNAKHLIQNIFGIDSENGMFLKGFLSRKKQIVPLFMELD